MLAKWWDEEIMLRKIHPTITGEQSFTLLKSYVYNMAGRKSFTTHFRQVLRTYGYKIKILKREIEITKFIS